VRRLKRGQGLVVKTGGVVLDDEPRKLQLRACIKVWILGTGVSRKAEVIDRAAKVAKLLIAMRS
jgi:hypothetical protein